MLAGPRPTPIRPPVLRPRFGSILTTAFARGIAAQALPGPTATSWQISGTGMRFVAPDRGSTRITLEDPAPATQTDPSPTSTPRGPGPTVMILRTSFFRGSTSTTFRSTSFVTQTP